VARILPQSEIRTRGTSKQQPPQLELAGKEAELKKLMEAAMEDQEDDVEDEEGEEEEEEEPSRPPSPKLLRFHIPYLPYLLVGWLAVEFQWSMWDL
jgi:hypothetical protein